MKERWATVEDFPGYFVSDKGRVRSTLLWRGTTERILKPGGNGVGYDFVYLSRNKRAFKRYVHRLVAAAFIPNPLTLPEVNHENGIRNDNRASNLTWVTSKQNTTHMYEVLGATPANERNRKTYLVWREGEEPYRVENLTTFARERALNRSNCTQVALGHRLHHKGWHFAYADKAAA